MRLTIHAHLDYAFPAPADVLLQVEVAAQPDQRLETQSLTIHSDHPIRAVAGHEHVAPGRKRDPGAGFEWQRLKQCLAGSELDFAA